jgi:hypothetical protein
VQYEIGVEERAAEVAFTRAASIQAADSEEIRGVASAGGRVAGIVSGAATEEALVAVVRAAIGDVDSLIGDHPLKGIRIFL